MNKWFKPVCRTIVSKELMLQIRAAADSWNDICIRGDFR